MQVKWKKSLGQYPSSRPIVVNEGLLVAGSKSYIGVLSLETGTELAELNPTQKKTCAALLQSLSGRRFLTRFSGMGCTCVLDLDSGSITQLGGIAELHGLGFFENKWSVGSRGRMYTILTQSDEHYNITSIDFCCFDWGGNVIWQRDAWEYGYQVGIYKCGPHLLGISDSGIALLDPESGDILSKRKLEGGEVSGICIGTDRIWISRKGEGISSIDVPSLEHMHSFHSTEPAGFSNLREHGENLYGSTYSHLYSFSKDLETTNFVADCFLPEVDNEMHSGPCIVGKRLYVGSCNCHLWCIHLADGSIESRLEFRGFLNYDPVYHDGCLYVACNDENIYCIDISDDLSQ